MNVATPDPSDPHYYAQLALNTADTALAVAVLFGGVLLFVLGVLLVKALR